MSRLFTLLLLSLTALAACSDGSTPLLLQDASSPRGDSLRSDEQQSTERGDGLPLLSDASGELKAEVVSDLLRLREEEKLARDVYRSLYTKWPKIRPFDNIQKAEQKHMDAVLVVLKAYGIADPIRDDTVGVFEDPALRKLYGDLVAQGSSSELAALKVGATVEDLDIYDIEEMLTHTTVPSVVAMYQSLGCGSRNHMRSFIAQITSRGETYTPQYISIQAFQAIVAGDHETCTGG